MLSAPCSTSSCTTLDRGISIWCRSRCSRLPVIDLWQSAMSTGASSVSDASAAASKLAAIPAISTPCDTAPIAMPTGDSTSPSEINNASNFRMMPKLRSPPWTCMMNRWATTSSRYEVAVTVGWHRNRLQFADESAAAVADGSFLVANSLSSAHRTGIQLLRLDGGARGRLWISIPSRSRDFGH